MKQIYSYWPFEVNENGDIIFMDPSKPDRFSMREGDQFQCIFQNGHTTLIKIKHGDIKQGDH